MQKSLAIKHSLLAIVFIFFSCQSSSDRGTGQPSDKPAIVDSVLLSRFPDSLALRLDISNRFETSGDLRAALRVIESGLQRDGIQPILWNRKAALLLSMQDTTGAIGSLLKSLAVSPDQTDILLELGFIHADRRDPAAMAVAEQILSPGGDPKFQAEAHYLKGIYLGNIGRKAEAIQAYDNAIRSSYTFTDAYIEKGILLFEQGSTDAARAVFEKVLVVNNSLSDAYYWRGRCKESNGQRTAALEDYRRALSLDPDLRGAQAGEKRLSN